MILNSIEHTQKINNNPLYWSYKIKDSTISNINNILSINNQDKIIEKIKELKNNWSKLYQDNSLNINQKVEILTTILQNISKLLNNLNIDRVYNNSTFLENENNQSISKIEDITKMMHIKWTDLIDSDIVWVSCNEWVNYIYNLIRDITNSDEDIEYDFQVNTNDAHWILYINIWNKRFSFDSVVHSLSFEEVEKWTHKFKKKNKPKFFKEHNQYINFSDQEMSKKNTLVYDFDWKKLKIVKKWLILMVIYKNKPVKFINLHWLKKITKNISKVPSIKYIWLVPKVYNIDQIKEFILSKIDNNSESYDEVQFILKKLHDEKLLQFFNLSNL